MHDSLFKFHRPAFALGARQGFFPEAVEALESSRAVLLCSADCVGQHLVARKLVIFLVVNIPNSVCNFGSFYPQYFGDKFLNGSGVWTIEATKSQKISSSQCLQHGKCCRGLKLGAWKCREKFSAHLNPEVRMTAGTRLIRSIYIYVYIHSLSLSIII